jgi:hypothetical protein
VGRTKKVAEVPIQETLCWNCSLLEHIRFRDFNGCVVERFRCPKNVFLPRMLMPCFAEKCALFKPKEEQTFGE